MNNVRLFLTGFGIILILGLSLFLSDFTKEQNLTGFATKNDQRTVCDGADYDDLKTSTYKVCAHHIDDVSSAMIANNLDTEGHDLMYFLNLGLQETSCSPKDAEGLFKESSCNSNTCPTSADKARVGLKKYANYESQLRNKGLVGKELDELTLFAFNRGITTALNAVKKIDAGESVTNAMNNACKEIYIKDGEGCTYCEYDIEGNDKCLSEGYGARYVTRFFENFEKMCDASDGTVIQGKSNTEIKITTFGNYKIQPNFRTSVDASLKPYELLKTFSEDVIASCQNDPEQCVKNKILEFNNANTEIELTDSCEEGPEKVLYDLAERIYDCSKTTETNCFCSFTRNYHEDTIGNEFDTTNFKFNVTYKFKRENDFYYEFLIEKPEKLTYSVMVASHNEINFTEIDYLNENHWTDTIIDFLKFWKSDDNRKFIYLSNGKYSLAEVENDDKFKLVKNGQEFSPINWCEDSEKTQFRFCATVNDLVKNYENGKFSYEKPKIKFALTLEDKSPPEHSSYLNGLDVVTSAGSTKRFLVLEWKEHNEKIATYNVYHGSTEFLNLARAQSVAKKEELFNFGITSTTYDRIDSIGAISCTSIFCTIGFGGQSKTINPDRFFKTPLDQLSNDQTIVYVLEVPLTEYYVAVTAVDAAGNENEINQLNLISIPNAQQQTI